jgi:pullulanase/glycogen debranching enzyme
VPPARRPCAGWTAREGAPRPLGATWLPAERAVNFALYSKHAERVTLLLFRPDDLTRPHLARARPAPPQVGARVALPDPGGRR